MLSACILADKKTYFKEASLASAEGLVFAAGEEAAFSRRDLAIKGFNQLRERMTTQGASAVSDFYRAAIETVRPNLKHWRSVWKKSVLAVTQSTEKQLESIDQGKTDHLADGRVYTLPTPDGERKLGFCEWLSPYKSK